MAENKTLLKQGMDIIDAMDQTELNLLVDYIRDVYKSKNALNKARAFASLAEGDKVKYGPNARPSYLAGKTGVIEEKRQTRVLIKLDCGPIGKFRTGRVIAHPTSLTKIEG